MDEMLGDLAAALAEVCRRIGSFLDASAQPRSPSPSKAADRSAVKAAVEALTRYGEASDSEVLEYLESARETIRAGAPQKDVEELSAFLRAYDFPAALEVLRHIARDLEKQ